MNSLLRALCCACVALALLALPTMAQTDPNVCDQPGEEPDVIVGDLPGTNSYGSVGDIAGSRSS